MSIGIDCRLWDQTGVGRYIRNLVSNLQKIDKTNDYVLFVRSKDREDIQQQLGLIGDINNKQSKWKIVNVDIRWHSIEEQVNFPKILEKEKLDLMHFPYFSVPVSYNRLFVVTVHDLIMDHFPTGNASTLMFPVYYLKYLAYRYIIKKTCSKAKKIIVPSKATKTEVMAHLGVTNDKIMVTYEAANERSFHETSDLKYKEFIMTEYFLCVGNAYPHKNLERLIEAFIGLKEPGPKPKDLKLVLVGRRDYFYQRLEEKTKTDKVIFLGKVSNEELAVLYRNALALVQPSLMEGFGLPVLEAMANKCVVVCSDIPSLREIAGEGAVYFDPKNTEDIKKNLELVSKDPQLRAKIIEKAFKRSQDFSWEKMAKETLAVYNSALNNL